MSRENPGGVPAATVARLPVYLKVVLDLVEHGMVTVSSEELASSCGVSPAMLRKDISHLGSFGTRGVGYELTYLAAQISQGLGLTQHWPVAIVGIGSLGQALARSSGFGSGGFTVVALLDVGDVVGQEVAGLKVQHVDELETVVHSRQVSIGVIATPGAAAQEVCNRLVAAGVTSILTFAPVVLQVPDGVDVRRVDLSTELQILAFHEQRKTTSALNQTLNRASTATTTTSTQSAVSAAGGGK